MSLLLPRSSGKVAHVELPLHDATRHVAGVCVFRMKLGALFNLDLCPVMNGQPLQMLCKNTQVGVGGAAAAAVGATTTTTITTTTIHTVHQAAGSSAFSAAVTSTAALKYDPYRAAV